MRGERQTFPLAPCGEASALQSLAQSLPIQRTLSKNSRKLVDEWAQRPRAGLPCLEGIQPSECTRLGESAQCSLSNPSLGEYFMKKLHGGDVGLGEALNVLNEGD